MFGIPNDDPVEKYSEAYCRKAIDKVRESDLVLYPCFADDLSI